MDYFLTLAATAVSKVSFIEFFMRHRLHIAECGVPNRDTRILGGEYLRSYEFPWLALINNFKDNSVFLGTLINNKYVITAATVLVR